MNKKISPTKCKYFSKIMNVDELIAGLDRLKKCIFQSSRYEFNLYGFLYLLILYSKYSNKDSTEFKKFADYQFFLATLVE